MIPTSITDKKIKSIFLTIMIMELIIGGTGKVLYMPIRMLIFGIGLLMIILQYKKIKISKSDTILACIVLTYIVAQMLLGGFRGNSLGDIYDDISMYMSLLYIPIIFVLSDYDKSYPKKIVEMVINGSVIISIVTILVFIWGWILLKFGLGNPIEILNEFEENYNYGIITWYLYGGDFIRVYFASGIFMQIALALLINRNYVGINKRNDKLKKIIILFGIITSGTRGYWLGAMIVIGLVLILNFNIDKKTLRFIFRIICIVGIVALILFSLGMGKDIVERMITMFDFKGDVSNNTRSIQLNFLMHEIIQKPLLGWGFGKNVPAYTSFTGRGSRHFELFYFEIIMKIGLIGIGILITIILYYFYKAYKVIHNLRKNGKYEEQSIVQGWTIALISLFIINATNPYISGAAGFSIISIYIYILFIFSINKGESV